MSLDTHLSDLRRSTTLASMNFDVWWALKSKAVREAHTATMNLYPEFFQTAIHAHFVALLIPLYGLYETRTDTHNIPRLIRKLQKTPAFSAPTLAKVDVLLAEAKPTWIKVQILRNEVFGHRSSSTSIEQAFKKAGVTANELKRLIAATKRLLNCISKEYDGTEHAFNLCAESATLRLLEDLASAQRRKASL